MAKVKKVSSQGVLYKKVKKGEEVIAFDNRPFEDLLDYIYADSNNTCKITLKDKKGKQRIVHSEKEFQDDTLGLEFDKSINIKPKTCSNKCIFCFVDQLPKAMRDTLYVKDDDYRLSFISGCYITLTNLSQQDIERIISYKLSPLYISVHATDETIRKKMLGVKKVKPVLEIIKKLVDNGISLHTKVVHVPGINDTSLQKTICDLYDAKVKSLAIVPVGLTKHRQGLHKIDCVDKDLAKKAIQTVESFYEKHPYFSFASDEMYEIAEMAVKEYQYYGEFEQIENGVGLVAKFLYEIKSALEFAPKALNKSIAVLTGVSGYNTMKEAKSLIEKTIKGVEIHIYPIENRFFGKTVTVSGLVVGTDICTELENKEIQGDFVVIPSVMLKEFGEVFLDGMTIKQVQKRIKKKIVASAVDGDCFLQTIIDGV